MVLAHTSLRVTIAQETRHSMKLETKDLVILGGGPAGLAAAIAAYDEGLRDILVIERDRALGGILNQCIHNGFGLHRFGEELTGPEYAERYIKAFEERGIEARLDAMVLSLHEDRVLTLASPARGFEMIKAKAVILAMGSRERTRGQINTPGTRPAGVLTAGTAQRYVNLEGLNVGKDIVILGSGDIGLIMARRMSLEGANVHACIEIMETPGGLNRNIVQCLEDFDIPLLLSHTITRIMGRDHLEAVEIAQVDLQLQPIRGTERVIPCDTLLLSVGLIPENELSREAGVKLDTRTSGPFVDDTFQTSVPGIFACGNVLHIHDLVDHVSEEAERAGQSAARLILEGALDDEQVEKDYCPIQAGRGLRYTVPQRFELDAGRDLILRFRVTHQANEQMIIVKADGEKIANFKRAYVAPGEMENIKLPWKLLERAGHPSTLEVSMEPYL